MPCHNCLGEDVAIREVRISSNSHLTILGYQPAICYLSSPANSADKSVIVTIKSPNVHLALTQCVSSTRAHAFKTAGMHVGCGALGF
jgi:hypothetical protein